MAPWLRQSRAAGHPMRSLRPISRRVLGRPGAVQRYPNLDEISLSSVCSTTKLAPRVGIASTCKRLICRCLHGPLLQVTPKPAATVQPCDELEEVLKIAAFAQPRNLRSTDPARATTAVKTFGRALFVRRTQLPGR